MKNFIEKLTAQAVEQEVPEFMSCSSFETDVEYVMHTQEPRLLFEVREEGDVKEPFTRLIEHENGDADYLVLVDCYSKNYFDGMTPEQGAHEIDDIMDLMEGWYISEVLDLDSYED